MRLRTATPRANSDDERDAVGPRAMQNDDVENIQSSAEPSGGGNRDQSGSGEVHLLAKQCKHLRKERIDLLRQFCNVTLTRELRVPMDQSQTAAWI